MRNRNLILALTVLVAVFFAAGCGSTRQLTKAESDKIAAHDAQINKAIQMDAKTCAPKELANAQADLDRSRLECTQSWENCDRQIGVAGKSITVLMEKLEECNDNKQQPTCGLVAEPSVVAPGNCATLKWKGANVEKIVWGSDEKDVNAEVAPLSGTKEVCPAETTDYKMSCVGKSATTYETARVTVSSKPVPAPVKGAKVELRVNFDTDKATIRPSDLAELQKGVQFLTDNPNSKISIVGHTDSRGGDAYNQKLSEARADAVKKYLEGEVAIKAENISAEGKGKTEPIGNNATKGGQFQNRRVEILIAD